MHTRHQQLDSRSWSPTFAGQKDVVIKYDRRHEHVREVRRSKEEGQGERETLCVCGPFILAQCWGEEAGKRRRGGGGEKMRGWEERGP
eukprot:7389268-Pyramimonas_sp.AAC.1